MRISATKIVPLYITFLCAIVCTVVCAVPAFAYADELPAAANDGAHSGALEYAADSEQEALPVEAIEAAAKPVLVCGGSSAECEATAAASGAEAAAGAVASGAEAAVSKADAAEATEAPAKAVEATKAAEATEAPATATEAPAAKVAKAAGATETAKATEAAEVPAANAETHTAATLENREAASSTEEQTAPLSETPNNNPADTVEENPAFGTEALASNAAALEESSNKATDSESLDQQAASTKDVPEKEVLAPAVAQSKGPVSSGSAGETWERLAGAKAVDTMAQIVQEGWASSNSVVIATDYTYQDALTASPLAGYLKAPILLSHYASLPDVTRAEIKRLNAQNVYIVGGTYVITEEVERQINSLGLSKVERIAGLHAEDTAVAIAEYLKGAHSSTAIVATDYTYQDALSIAPYAYKTVSPIYLTSNIGNTLSANTRTSLANGGYSRAVIVGGPYVVKQAVESQIRNTGISNVNRLWGQNAEGTSSRIAEWSVDQGMSPANVGVATSQDYCDALVGSALCGKNNSPILLAKNTNRSVVYSFLNKNRSRISHAYIFGGNYVVSAATEDLLKKGTTKVAYSNTDGYDMTGVSKLGIDVSVWQGYIDWHKVKQSGIDFAIVRLTHGGRDTFYDTRYEYNLRAAREAGIELGVYIYSDASTVEGARKEADRVLTLLQRVGFTADDLPLGVYYDLEESDMQKVSNRPLLLDMTKTFMARLESAGYSKLGVYANLNWWTNYLPSSEYNQWSRWVAQYNSQCDYFGGYKMWQFRSTGRVPGIAEEVDMNMGYW